MKQKVFAFGCTICHKSFTQLKSLGEHVEKFHSNEKSEINDENPQSLPVSKEKKQKTLSPIKLDTIKNVSRVFWRRIVNTVKKFVKQASFVLKKNAYFHTTVVLTFYLSPVSTS